MKFERNYVLINSYITLCSGVEVIRRFGGSYRSHILGRRLSRARKQHEAKSIGTHGVISQNIEVFNTHRSENLVSAFVHIASGCLLWFKCVY
jgi:hypothetical protein